MATITFDTLELTDSLKRSGIPAEQAEAVIRAIAKAQDSLVTQSYLDNAIEKALNPVRADLATLRADQAVLKWMMGVLLAGVLSLVMKTFF